MYSIEVIRAMNKEKSEKAKNEGLQPYIAKKDNDEGVKACKVLGDFIPIGWEKVNTYFVDNSGFGSENESALTFGQLLNKIKKGYGYTIGEQGQFQIYIHEYKKI